MLFSQNFNILLHGLGSKRGLLDLFRKECLSEETHVVVNGYFPALTLQHVSHILSFDLYGMSARE